MNEIDLSHSVIESQAEDASNRLSQCAWSSAEDNVQQPARQPAAMGGEVRRTETRRDDGTLESTMERSTSGASRQTDYHADGCTPSRQICADSSGYREINWYNLQGALTNSRTLYPNNEVRTEVNYYPDGMMRRRETYQPDGRLEEGTEYHRNGAVSARGIGHNDRSVTWTHYDNNGRLLYRFNTNTGHVPSEASP